MAALAAISSATPSLQSTLVRSRLQAAQREVERAEAYAQSLQEQADSQDRVVNQARQRVRSLQQSSTNASTPQAATSEAKLPVADGTTYTEQLSGIFQFAKPLLKLDLSSTQKNIVIGSLFDATNVTSSTQQASSQAVQQYSSQAANTPTSTTVGRFINTKA